MKKKAPKIPDRRAAIAGERWQRASEGELEVKPKTEGNQGQWICIRCDIPLSNNMEKDFHCSSPAQGRNRMTLVKGAEARHVLAWRSFVSGETEVP